MSGEYYDDDDPSTLPTLTAFAEATTTPTTSVALPPQEARLETLVPYGLIAMFLGLFLFIYGARNYRNNGPPPRHPLAQKMVRDPALYTNDDLGDEDSFLGESSLEKQKLGTPV
jgi:hypothetical protein